MIIKSRHILTLVLACLLTFNSGTAAPAPVERDIIIYGGTSAGIAAAVQARRMGKTVIIVEPANRIGGLTTGGLGQTDIGNKQVIGGIAREFYKAVRSYYMNDDAAAWKWQNRADFKTSKHRLDDEAWWVFEPSVALKIYEGWISRDNIEIIKNERLDRKNGLLVAAEGMAEGAGRRIAGFRTESGREFRGRVFIDATYEGDLMALAGVSHTIGREANATYRETLNGVQTLNSKTHNFRPGVDPYIIKGDPASGLLPFIDPTGPGGEGSADKRLQAYCFRLCLTNNPENRMPFQKPDGYREDWYELLFRNFEAGLARVPWINSPMPNAKTDINNRDGFSTDFIGRNYDYPEAGYAAREKIIKQHLLYTQGLMWTLANHPRVPQKIRDDVSQWGVTRDEFVETGGWPGQLYIREARRMIGALVMTQHHCLGGERAYDSIGMAAYTMDSHSTQRYVNKLMLRDRQDFVGPDLVSGRACVRGPMGNSRPDTRSGPTRCVTSVNKDGHVRNEGCIEKKGFPPYPVSYRALVPKQAECANLIVPVAMSASHIAYGSIRMEPVFMVFGQSAATAASLAIDDDIPVQKVSYAKLRQRLVLDGQVLEQAVAEPPSAPPSPIAQEDIRVDGLTPAIAALLKRPANPDDAGAQARRLVALMTPEEHTFEKKFEDSPAFGYDREPLEISGMRPVTDFTPSKVSSLLLNKEKTMAKIYNVHYKEGIFTGYHWFDMKKIEVRYPFGHGLSYTTFEYKNIRLEKQSGGEVTASITLTNTGKRDGAEIAQLYVSDLESSVPRPPRELKAFERVALSAGESRTVTFRLDAAAFSYWDENIRDWRLEPGEFEIQVGPSSRDLPLRVRVRL